LVLSLTVASPNVVRLAHKQLKKKVDAIEAFEFSMQTAPPLLSAVQFAKKTVFDGNSVRYRKRQSTARFPGSAVIELTVTDANGSGIIDENRTTGARGGDGKKSGIGDVEG
jgi:hypothetical protein